MYTLLSGLYQQYTQKQDYFLVILGLDNAGKTTFLEKTKQLYTGKGLEPEQIAPTVGLNVGKIVIQQQRLNFWDLGGQEQLRSLWEKYYDECHGIIFIVDSTDKERIEQVKEALETVILKEQEGVPILMLCNKQDLPDALQVYEIKEIFNQIALRLEARDSKVLAISALQGTGITDAIQWIHTRIVANQQHRPPVFK